MENPRTLLHPASPLCAISLNNRLAGRELLDYFVGVVGEGKKICCNLSRKFDCRGTITFAGGG